MAHNDNALKFKQGDYVVYPAHGVGKIDGVEKQKIGGMEVELYSVSFEKDRMRLKVPTFKVKEAGLRKISSTNSMDDAIETLKGKSKVRRIMWSRRAAEYEMKINSGNPQEIAEVLRELFLLKENKNLSFGEKKMLDQCRELIAQEISISGGKDSVEVKTQINSCFPSGEAV